jgi:hypothetical protein
VRPKGRQTLVALLSLAFVVASACTEWQPTVAQPAPVPPAAPVPPPLPPPLSPAARVIRIGERVEGALTGHGTRQLYELTTMSQGMLVAELSWTGEHRLLELQLDDKVFVSDRFGATGTLEVAAGRTYRVSVSDGAPWDYDELFVRFALTTSMK